MEPAEIQRTIEHLPSHTSVNIPKEEMERITASLLIARCARCHGEETLNLDGAQDAARARRDNPPDGGAPRLGRASGSGTRHRASV